MNSWNGSTSYANNLKIYHLGFPRELEGRAWDLIFMDEVRDAFHNLIREWSLEQGDRWTAGFNGRSSGYLVLYQQEANLTDGHTARCARCGRTTWHKEKTPCTEDSLDLLRNRVELVQKFDGLCDDIVTCFAEFCRNFEVVEEEILVPETIKVLKERDV